MTETAELPFPEIIDPPQVPAAPAAAAVPVPVEMNVEQFLTAGLRSHEPALVALKTKHAAVKVDVSTPAGMNDAKARRLELRERGRYMLQRLEESLTKDLSGAKKVIAKEVERLVGIVKPEEDRFHNAIQAEEDRKERERQEAIRKDEERKERHRAGVRRILNYITLAGEIPAEERAARLGKGVAALKEMQFGDEWEEFKAEAEGARQDALKHLTAMHEQAVEADRLREENARLRAAAPVASTVTTASGIVADANSGEIQNAPPAQPVATESAEQQDREAATPTAAAAPHAVGTPAVSAPLPAPAPAGGFGIVANKPAAASADPVKLGDLNERLGFTMTEHFVRHTLGVTPVPGKGRAVLIAVDDLPVLRSALLQHVKVVDL